jgi:hypothetical protein
MLRTCYALVVLLLLAARPASAEVKGAKPLSSLSTNQKVLFLRWYRARAKVVTSRKKASTTARTSATRRTVVVVRQQVAPKKEAGMSAGSGRSRPVRSEQGRPQVRARRSSLTTLTLALTSPSNPDVPRRQERIKDLPGHDPTRRIHPARRRIQRTTAVIARVPKQPLPVVVGPSNPQPSAQQSALERLRLQLELSLME